MEERKFDEMMEAYARSTSKGEEHDLKKLRRFESKPTRRVNRKVVFAVCSAVLSVAVCLAIVLPLTLNTEQGDGSAQRYFSDGEYIRNVPFVGMDALSAYSEDFMLPEIESIAVGGMLKINDIEDELGGIMLEVSVYDEHFDYFTMQMYYENYIYSFGDLYAVCVNTTVWNGIEVKYNTNARGNGAHDWMMKFYSGGVNYYLSFLFYGEAEADDILDMIF